MYTPEGNEAVKNMLTKIRREYKLDPRVRNRRTLREFIINTGYLKDLASVHPEVHDTEPRSHIANALDAICEFEGWSYDPWLPWELL